jgi:CRP/FNR family cyclic AMP-dependent transcriptional regulator
MLSNSIERLLLVEKVLILKSLTIFKDTPENILADLAPLMQEEDFEKNTVLFHEGEIGDCMYIIRNGEIRIHKGHTTLAVFGENEVFGELSLLDAEKRSASATCLTDSTLFRIDQEPFYELIEARPEVARGFIKILCQRLRAQNEKTVQPGN